MGNDVMCLDVDSAKIALLRQGGIPIYEPGLEDLVRRNVQAGRLHFTDDVAQSVAFGDVRFIAVGTPPGEDGSADLKYAGRRPQHCAPHDLAQAHRGQVRARRHRRQGARGDRQELAARGVDLPFTVASIRNSSRKARPSTTS